MGALVHFVHSYIYCTYFPFLSLAQRHQPLSCKVQIVCVQHVMPCGNTICTGTSACVVCSLSTNHHPSNVFCVACVDVMSANPPLEWPGLLLVGL